MIDNPELKAGVDMKFACNYSRELMEILRENPSFCDYVKIGAFGETLPHLKEAFVYKPLIIHGFGWFERGGMKDTQCMDFDYMNHMLHEYESPFLGMHALAYPDDLTADMNLLDHMKDIFAKIKEQLQVELLIENLDYSPFYLYKTTVRESVTPSFLTQLVEGIKGKMLLDISHAKVSSFQLKMDVFDYLEALPLHLIREIHISGSFYTKDEGFKDIHGIMDESDYRIAFFLAKNERIKTAKVLQVVTLEYGTINKADKSAIELQMARLKDIFKDI